RAAAAVVGAVGADQRDRGLQHRQAAVQALRGPAGGAAAGLLALRQAVDVAAQVDAAAVVGPGPGLDQAAADVGVQGGGADAEQGASFAGGHQVVTGGGRLGHGFSLIRSIKIDQPDEGCHIACLRDIPRRCPKGPPCPPPRPPAHASAPPSPPNRRCRWWARSTPTTPCSRSAPATARSTCPAAPSRPARWACPTSASTRSRTY